MRFTNIASIFILIFVMGCTGESSRQSEVEIVATNLDVPWSMDFLPDGSLIFTERRGTINVLQNGTVERIGTVPSTSTAEGGFLGLAVHPEFEENNFVYLYYTYRIETGELYNKVVRARLTANTLTEERVIIDKIPGAQNHNGGRIKFGPEGLLYITTGDAQIRESAQDVNGLAGKILRVTDAGEIPADNPFNSPIYTYGHRNPQGLAWNPLTGTLYESEHGQVGNDEINIIKKGKNYGWPHEECNARNNHALMCFNYTHAPSGIAFHNNNLYVAGLRGSHVRKIGLGIDGNVVSSEIFLAGYGRIRDVVTGPDGYLYISTSNRDGRGFPRPDDDRILRIRPG